MKPHCPTTPVICGPTAGGKSQIAIDLARTLIDRGHPAEIVTADSMQIYRGMDIGTAKPDAEQQAGIPHHLIDVVEPEARFTVADWLGLAEPLIEKLKARGVIPIVVGGTHLYVKALIDGLMEGPAPDESVRAELSDMDPAVRRAELERVDPEAASRIHPNDTRRTIRALEVYRVTGEPMSVRQSQWDDRGRKDVRLVGLEWETPSLNQRINARVRSMIEDGLENEVRGLWELKRLGPQACEGLGYKQFIHRFEGRYTHEEAVETIKIETRRFAKNQRTWLKRLRRTPGSLWISPEHAERRDLVHGLIESLGI